MAELEEGIKLIRNGLLGDAELFFIRELENNPEDEGMWRFLGRTQSEVGKKDLAEKSIEKAIELNPEQPMWLYKLLVENKLKFEFIDQHCNLSKNAKDIFLNKKK